MEPEDSYLTIAAPAEASSRERSSKFLAYAYPVQQEEQIREILDGLRKNATTRRTIATHGGWGRRRRIPANDGEPGNGREADSGTAAFRQP